MNLIKFYKNGPLTAGNWTYDNIQRVRVNQTKARMGRLVSEAPSLLNPDGLREIPDRLPTMAQACARMTAKGWTRRPS